MNADTSCLFYPWQRSASESHTCRDKADQESTCRNSIIQWLIALDDRKTRENDLCRRCACEVTRLATRRCKRARSRKHFIVRTSSFAVVQINSSQSVVNFTSLQSVVETVSSLQLVVAIRTSQLVQISCEQFLFKKHLRLIFL